MKQKNINIVAFDTKKSIQRANNKSFSLNLNEIKSKENEFVWTNALERVSIIRKGIPYQSIELISKRINRPVKSILAILGVPQTTYNKKKSENSLLDHKDTELIILMNELIDYGIEVFNNEEDKFQRWLRKPNLSLSGYTPESLLDTASGIEEVKYTLNRIEFGSFA